MYGLHWTPFLTTGSFLAIAGNMTVISLRTLQLQMKLSESAPTRIWHANIYFFHGHGASVEFPNSHQRLIASEASTQSIIDEVYQVCLDN